jgi:ABC-2 type transport system permease protein
MFVFLVPMLTMKLFAEEKASGTIELLMSAPVSSASIVAGKYLGSLVFYSLVIASAVVYYAVIEMYGTPDRMATLGGFIGIWLEGAMFIAAGMMASSWCKSQTLAAIGGYVVLFVLYFSPSFAEYAQGGVKTFISYAGTMSHAANFAAGLILLEDVVYYLSLIFLFLAFTRLSLETRFWR